MAKKVVVVRVGAKTIRIVHMDNTPVNPTVYGCVRVPTPQGGVVDGEVKNIMEVSRRIRQACQEKGITTKDVIFSLSSSKIANRETTIPYVKDSKIQGVVDAKVGDLFPVDTDRYIFSYVKQGGERVAEAGEKVTDGSKPEEEKEELEEIEVSDDTVEKTKEKKGFSLPFGKKKGEGEEGGSDQTGSGETAERVLDLLVYAAPTDLVRSYYALAEGCDFNVVGIEVDGNGIFQIMRRQVQEGVEMAIQVNRDSTLINIMSKDKLLLQRVIPYGTMTILSVVMNEPAFQAQEYDQAVNLLATQRVMLHTLNASNPQNDLSMQKRIELTQSANSLISNIYRVMEYYNARFREDPIRRIIMTGNGAKIAGLHELMTNELGVPTSTPNELSGVLFNRQIEVNANILQYVGCFGAVYSPVNFIPEDIKNRAATRDSLRTITIGLIAVAAVCVIVSAISFIRLGTAYSAYKTAHDKVVSMQPIKAKNNELLETKEQVRIYSYLDDITNTSNNSLHAILDDVKARVPDSFVIRSINSNDSSAVINCVSTDKLSSVAALLMRLSLVENIQNVRITSSIAKSEDATTMKRQYEYTVEYDYVSDYEKKDTFFKEYIEDVYAEEVTQ